MLFASGVDMVEKVPSLVSAHPTSTRRATPPSTLTIDRILSSLHVFTPRCARITLD
jgi:hypothetical protein